MAPTQRGHAQIEKIDWGSYSLPYLGEPHTEAGSVFQHGVLPKEIQEFSMSWGSYIKKGLRTHKNKLALNLGPV